MSSRNPQQDFISILSLSLYGVKEAGSNAAEREG